MKKSIISLLWGTAALIAVMFILLFAANKSYGQSFNLTTHVPFVCTDMAFDSTGNMWTSQQQGQLRKNGEIYKIFPVMFREECGLVGIETDSVFVYLHISGQDSIQRIIRFDTVSYLTDTIIEVPYKEPFSSRHRGGDIIIADSILYCTFGYGSDPMSSQYLDDYRGKLLNINLNTGEVLISGFGFRNPFRFGYNESAGFGYVADVGSNIAEEINYFTKYHSLLDHGWPCFEGDSQLITPDTVCSDYALSFPEFMYSQPSPRSITGGVFFGSEWYYTDYYTGLGGKIDSLWHLTPIGYIDSAGVVVGGFPEGVTGMAVNTVNNTLNVCTWIGDVYEMSDIPLSLPDIGEKPQNGRRGLVYSNNAISWDTGVGRIVIFSIDGRLLFSANMEETFFIDLTDFLPGIYAVVIYNPDIQYSKTFIKL